MKTKQENSVFHPAEFWKSALMTLPDNSFFELMRSAFGKIKTPFNKQQLLSDLEKFLLRLDIQKTVAAYIDDNDKKIICAVAVFNDPVQEDLEKFFADEFSFVQLHDIIVNLEERFILYRYKDGDSAGNKKIKLALNPLLEKVLSPVTENAAIIFPVQKETGKKPDRTSPGLNDCILAGLMSFVLGWEDTDFYTTDWQLRRQILKAGKTCFPGLDLYKIFCALQMLGLFYTDKERIVPDKNRLSDIAMLSARERMEYCAAAFLVYNEAGNPVNIQAAYYKNRINEAVKFIHSLMDSLDAINKNSANDVCFNERTLVRLIQIQKSKTEYTFKINTLIDILAETELIKKISGSLYQNNCSLLNANSLLPCITIDSSFSILVYPEINFKDAIELASFSNLKETGAVTRFEIDKKAAARAFDNGYTVQQIIDLLNRLSGGKLPDTLVWNLEDWEKRYSAVRIKKGIVLSLSEDKQYILQSFSSIKNNETDYETLAPGVYLFNEDAEEEIIDKLNSAGIDIIARKKNLRANANNLNYFPAPSGYSNSCIISANNEKNFDNNNELSIQKKKEFHSVLGKLSLNKTDSEELAARIDRRLILCESQLKDADIRYEKLEARNMDYAGKQNIIKQAIALKSMVEIVWRVSGKEEQIYGIPAALEKKDSGLFVNITPIGEGEQSIPLAKISLVRRIKKSIFEG